MTMMMTLRVSCFFLTTAQVKCTHHVIQRSELPLKIVLQMLARLGPEGARANTFVAQKARSVCGNEPSCCYTLCYRHCI